MQAEHPPATQILFSCLSVHSELMPPLVELTKAEGIEYVWVLSKSLQALFRSVIGGKVRHDSCVPAWRQAEEG